MISQYNNTKILATLGPATGSMEKILELISAGIDGVRLNFSHGNHDYYEQVFKNVNDACVEASEPIAVLIDLQGPKIRVGELQESMYVLQDNDKVVITMKDITGTGSRFSCSYKGLSRDAKIGDTIFINDGLVKLVVTGTDEDEVTCNVIEGGILQPRKGINLPGMDIKLPSLTEKDFSDLEFALTHRVDFIALSFVRKAEDVSVLRNFLTAKGIRKNIIAKIEKPEAVKNIDEIIDVSDGIMIARGDLGVELPPQEVPVIQKNIIRKCNLLGKMVITATQMLESMVSNPVPTRAETSDVANAVWDGTDVVMLSGETSVGKFPVETVKMMNEIITNAEQHYNSNENIKFQIPEALEENLFDSVLKGITSVAEQTKANAIVVFTYKGRAARGLAKFRPTARIIALSDSFETMNNLCLRWGVNSLFINKIDKQNAAIEDAKNLILNAGLVNKGELVIFLSRAPFTEKGRSDFLHFEVL